MTPKPTLVKLIKSYGNEYDVRFPELKLKLTINRYYYTRMSNNPKKYKFI